MEQLAAKAARLTEILKTLGSAAVAFSAGVDSAYLAYTAHEVLGERMNAVTVDVPSFPKRELEQSREFCGRYGIRQTVIAVDQLSVAGFAENPPDRCYHCKRALFSAIKQTADDLGLAHVIEGSNLDDMSVYRPGLGAISELGITSPLKEAGLTKSDIRALSKAAGLPTWDKPSFACLATRIPYGDRITPEKLLMTELAEDKLAELGFTQYRVRVHGDVARIELPEADIPRLTDPVLRSEVIACFSRLGFSYTALDLAGYRTGSMDIRLTEKAHT